MCKFLSAIAFKNGDILCNPSVDSHEDLISLHDLKETRLRKWVRIEYYPADNQDYDKIEKYNLHLDDTEFDWINDNLKGKWINKLNAKLDLIIIKENRKILPSGTFILSGNVLINKLLYCRILHAGHSTIMDAGRSTIKHAGYSTIEDAGSSTIKHAENSTIEDAGSSTIKHAGRSTIKHAGYSTIKDAGYSTIKHAGHSTIKYAENSTIKHAGSSTIEYAGYSTIKYAGSSTIKYAENSTIKNAENSTIINK